MHQATANLLDSLDPVEAAKHSFFDFHARGLTYLCLFRSARLTMKLYLAFAGETAPNVNGFLVDPHDHAYDFKTEVLSGTLTNITFVDPPGPFATYEAGWNRFHYGSPLRGGAGFVSDAPAPLHEVSRTVIPAGGSYELNRHVVHTIAVDRDETTVLLLTQYHDRPDKETTRFYSQATKPPSVTGLYRPMTPEDIEVLVRRFHRIGEAA